MHRRPLWLWAARAHRRRLRLRAARAHRLLRQRWRIGGWRRRTGLQDPHPHLSDSEQQTPSSPSRRRAATEVPRYAHLLLLISSVEPTTEPKKTETEFIGS
jgi:hypothetical protein